LDEAIAFERFIGLNAIVLWDFLVGPQIGNGDAGARSVIPPPMIRTLDEKLLRETASG
jgi:hypothetical protein